MIHTPLKMVRAIRSHFEGRDRGAALVEAAIAIPILLLVILGSIEFGFAWEARSTTTSGVRTGIIRAAALGDKPETDLRVLQSIVGEVGTDNVARIDWVKIYQGTPGTSHEAQINACPGATTCVSYDTAFLQQVAAVTDSNAFRIANFDLGGQKDPTDSCDQTKRDRGWCAGMRTIGGDVEIGIAIRYKHEWFTGIFPGNAPTFQDFSVTSTFQKDGADINPTVGIPGQIGEVANLNFDGGTLPPGITSTSNSTFNLLGDSSTKVLGRFGPEKVSITVETPQAHNQVCVSFTLWIIGSWDTNGDSGNGPDTFAFNIQGNTGADGGNELPPATYSQNGDSVETNLGNDKFGKSRKVTINQCQEHTGSEVTLDFIGNMIQSGGWAVGDESWAIDDLNVSVSNKT